MNENKTTRGKFIETVLVDGHPFPPIKNVENNVRSIRLMKIRKNDIILSTYPKCGTTWVQYIIWEILNDGKPPPNGNEMMVKYFPFIEMVGADTVELMPSPRTIKFHLPYRMTPMNEEAKYVSVMRNPFDTCVSFYHQLSAFYASQQNQFESYFEDFLEGRTPFGDYRELNQSWYEHRNDHNVLFLRYEELKKDHQKGVLDIARFIGREHVEKLEGDQNLLRTIIKQTTFDYLKANAPFRIAKDLATKKALESPFVTNTSSSMVDPKLFKDSDFYRKGTVGSSKTELTTEQWTRLEKYIEDGVMYPELKKMMLC